MALPTRESSCFCTNLNSKNFRNNNANTNNVTNCVVISSTKHDPRTEIPILLGEPTTKERRNSFERNAMPNQSKGWLRTIFLRDSSTSRNFASSNNHESTKSIEIENDHTGHSAAEFVDKEERVNINDGALNELKYPTLRVARASSYTKWSSKKVIIIWLITGISMIVFLTVSMCVLDFCN